LKVFGNGEKGGAVVRWLNSDQGEQVEQPMAIAIGFILQHFMQT
jgi:hypothetical protein